MENNRVQPLCVFMSLDLWTKCETPRNTRKIEKKPKHSHTTHRKSKQKLNGFLI